MTNEAYPSNEAMMAAVELEIHAALGQVQTAVIGRMIQKAIDASVTRNAQCARNTVIEECAAILDACAQDWNRIRDPGMANNARAYAKKIRALSAVPSTDGGQS